MSTTAPRSATPGLYSYYTTPSLYRALANSYLIPYRVDAIRAGGREGAMTRMKRDGVYRVDLVVGAVAFEGEIVLDSVLVEVGDAAPTLDRPDGVAWEDSMGTKTMRRSKKKSPWEATPAA